MDAADSNVVFLSYASQDAQPARRIAAALRAEGVEVWLDRGELRGGDAWDARIREQIKVCRLFVPLISATTQTRAEGYFRLEWRLADQRTLLMGRTRCFLVPVCLDDVAETAADVPDSFLAVQWARLGANGDGLVPFARRIRALLQADGVVCAAAPPISAIAPAAQSIAVLAFTNLSGIAENEYFSDGISEELLNVLAKIPGLHVTARTSAFFFKGKNVPVPEIAQRLGVAHLLEGSVRRIGNRVRITAQLIDAGKGFHVWSESFDREITDVFAVQDEIARAIAAKLELTFAPSARLPPDPEVHRLVLQGRFWWNEFTEEAFGRAEECFRLALQLDPGCAAALAGLANVSCRRTILTSVASRHAEALLSRAEADARAALARDPALAEPHAVLGTSAHMRGELAKAEREFRAALTLNPNSDLTLVYYARLLQRRGRPDLAVVELEKAHRLSPVVGAFAGHRANALIACGRYAEAIDITANAEKISAGSTWTRAWWALALARLGRGSEVPAKAREVLAPREDAAWTRGMSASIEGIAAWALAECGERNEAEDIAERLRLKPEPWRYAAGIPLAALGRRAEAFSLLEDIPQWFVDYVLILGAHNEAVRADPEFDALLRKLGAGEAFETLRCTTG
jgi:TolB-like protein/tetratricopeptide (TPR) repeat protein